MSDRLARPLRIACQVLLVLLVLAGCAKTGAPEPTSPPPLPSPTGNDPPISGDLDSAADFWQEKLDLDPENAEAHYRLGLILLLNEPQLALTYLDQAQTQDAGYAKPVSRLKTALRQAASIDDQPYQLTLAGQALASIEEWGLAEIALDQAVALDPEYAEAWAYLGETRQHTGSEDALTALQTAHSLKPNSFSANLFLSMYYRRAGQPLDAVKYLETALKSDPENKDLQADLAQTLVEAGGVAKGFALLEEIVEESPDDAENWLRLARLSIDNNLQVTETGLPAAREALLLAPDDPQAALLLGRAYLFLGEKVLAERFLTQALSSDEQSPEPHYYLAILYLNIGEADKAQTHFVAAHQLAQDAGNGMLSEQINELLNQYFGD